jgi:hypothetical protein
MDENGTVFIWFNPMDALHGLTGGEGPIYQFWCEACSAQWFPELLNMTQLIPSAPPIFYCLDPQCIAGNNLCTIAYGWLFSSFWAALTGGQEQNCSTCFG